MARDTASGTAPPPTAQGERPIPTPKATAGPSSADLVALIDEVLREGKAEDTVAIPLAGKTSFADYMVVCSAASQRQVTALADRLLERLKEAGHRPAGTEGYEAGDWVLLDVGDVIVHIFRSQIRSYYNLEKMWSLPAAADGGG